jgi:hypothetical protein
MACSTGAGTAPTTRSMTAPSMTALPDVVVTGQPGSHSRVTPSTEVSLGAIGGGADRALYQ